MSTSTGVWPFLKKAARAADLWNRFLLHFSITITTAIVGHLGDLELGAIFIANTVVGLTFNLLVGLESGLQTPSGEANTTGLAEGVLGSLIVLFIHCLLLLPLFFLLTPILKLLGQPSDIAELAGVVCKYLIPLPFCFALLISLQRFLQCKKDMIAVASISLILPMIYGLVSWLCVYRLKNGVTGVAIGMSISSWALVLGFMVYAACRWPFSAGIAFNGALSGLRDRIRYSVASGVVLSLDSSYYILLLVMTGHVENAKIAVSALAVCLSIDALLMNIPLVFLSATRMGVANKLQAGDAEEAHAVTTGLLKTSIVVGIFFSLLIFLLVFALHVRISLIFTSSRAVAAQVKKLTPFLSPKIFLNSGHPIFSGAAMGLGWLWKLVFVSLVHILVLTLLFWIGHKGFIDPVEIWIPIIVSATTFTLILCTIIGRCDWEEEANVASLRRIGVTDGGVP